MQRQQLFNSLSLSLIAAVLAAQPAGANTIKVSGVRLNPIAKGIEVILETPHGTSPPVFTSSYGKTFVADIINTQLGIPEGKTFHQENPTDGITEISVTSDADSIRVTVTGKVDVPVGQVVGSNKGLVLTLRTGGETSQTQASGQHSEMNEHKDSSINSTKVVAELPKVRSQTQLTGLHIDSSIVSQNSEDSDLSSIPIRSQIRDKQSQPPTTPAQDKFAGIHTESSVSLDGEESSMSASSTKAPSQDKPLRQSLDSGSLGEEERSAPASNTKDKPAQGKPLKSSADAPPFTPTPSTAALLRLIESKNTQRNARTSSLGRNIEEIDSGTTKQASRSSTSTLSDNLLAATAPSDRQGQLAPEFLNPNPNPLAVPTRPEQVQIRVTQPITLQQAFDVARRNNQALQVTELQLEASRAQLREARAALLPTISSNVAFTRSLTATGGTNSASSLLAQNGISSSALNSTTGTSTTSNSTTSNALNNTAGTSTNGTNASTGSISNPNGTNANGPTATNVSPAGTTGAISASPSGVNITGPTGTTNTPSSTTGIGTGTGTTVNTSTTIHPTTFVRGNVTLSYDLYTGGKRSATIRAAEEQVRNSELAVESQLEQLRLDVANDYYSLQAADEQVRIDQSAVANAQASLRDAIALEQAGLGTRFDTLQAEVTLANDQQALTRDVSQQLIARRQLAQELNIAQSVNLVAADPVQIAGLWKLSLEESIVQAFQNRAELQQQLAQRNYYRQQRIIALATLKPQVNLSAAYNLVSNNITSFSEVGPFGNGYSLQAQVSLLLFDAGAARARAAQADANVAIYETNFSNTRDQIRFAVEQSFYNLQANSANIQSARLALEQARESLRLARLRFQAGVGTQTDVINAEAALTTAEGNLVSAVLNYNRSLVSLERYVSTGRIGR